MSAALVTELRCPRATAGAIATINLNSACQQSWSRFWQAPLQPGVAERIVEQETLTAQFLGDLRALDRLRILVDQLAQADAESERTALVSAQVASIAHRFSEANSYLAQVDPTGPLSTAVARLSLSIDQACGVRLGEVLETRLQIVAEDSSLENLVPLGALLADLGQFDEADRIYVRALNEYRDVSPFAVAWVCFQLGCLWGELAPIPQPERAVQWYRKAIDYLPGYVKARVHLSELYVNDSRAREAEDLLLPVIAVGDPEVHWRLGDVLAAEGRHSEAEEQMQAARSGFEALLAKHYLAFADHGAEFYSGSGNDAVRALSLAMENVANRSTLRAFEQAYEIAIATGKSSTAAQVLSDGTRLWGNTPAFKRSRLAVCQASI
jgi:tetratricopeptide (TPR) repeat protein